MDTAHLTRALRAPNTHRGYEYAWRHFRAWSEGAGRDPLPASRDTVAAYLARELERGLKVTTVKHAIAAVAHFHRAAGLAVPDTRDLVRGARRLRVDGVRQVAPLEIAHLARISGMLEAENSARGARDRAILLVGFATALRSASLAFLTLADASLTADGLVIDVRKEKCDQEGKGRLIGVPHGKHPATCAVRAVVDWIHWRGRDAGPLFTRLKGSPVAHLQPERLGQIVQELVARIGLDPKLYGSHSMRAGFVTACGELGLGELLIASQTGHKDMATLRRYFRRRDIFRSNACGLLDL